MGTFRVPIEIGDPQGERYERVEAMVDSGASYTLVPASMLRGLGVTAHDRLTFFLADGRRVERDIGQTWVRIDGKSVITIVIFGEEDAEPLLGAYTLEGLRLGVDSFNRRLVPIPGYLLAFCGKGQPMQTKGPDGRPSGRMSNGGPTMRSRARLTGV